MKNKRNLAKITKRNTHKRKSKEAQKRAVEEEKLAKERKEKEELPLPLGKAYQPHRERMIERLKRIAINFFIIFLILFFYKIVKIFLLGEFNF